MIFLPQVRVTFKKRLDLPILKKDKSTPLFVHYVSRGDRMRFKIYGVSMSKRGGINLGKPQ